MRITELSRFPHPVLSAGSQDFETGEFDVDLVVEEEPSTGVVFVDHKVALTEPSIRKFVESGSASIGLFVRCDDTYYAELRRISWPKGRTDFAAGELLNRVTVRPLIWLNSDLRDWNPEGIHPEFQPPVSLLNGDVVGVGAEQIFTVGQAKLAALESIFVLQSVAEIPEGSVRVDPDAERVQIRVGPETHKAISLLRQQKNGLAVLLNGVYLPAVMEVLDLLGRDADYSNRRWYLAFTAKCDATGIDVNNLKSLLESAQLLLEFPAKYLPQLCTDAGGEG